MYSYRQRYASSQWPKCCGLTRRSRVSPQQHYFVLYKIMLPTALFCNVFSQVSLPNHERFARNSDFRSWGTTAHPRIPPPPFPASTRMEETGIWSLFIGDCLLFIFCNVSLSLFYWPFLLNTMKILIFKELEIEKFYFRLSACKGDKICLWTEGNPSVTDPS